MLFNLLQSEYLSLEVVKMRSVYAYRVSLYGSTVAFGFAKSRERAERIAVEVAIDAFPI